MAALRALQEHLHGLGRVMLGYSGGVDSTLLAVAATQALGPARFLAVIGRSPSLPESQHQAALAVAARFAIPVRELATRELEDSRYAANPTNRCYFCKSELWNRLTVLAAELGFDTVIDGTLADDLTEHRPGLRAAREYGIRSPLAELGWCKTDVRRAARSLGVPLWDAPASPCLASRVRYGLQVTPKRLRQVELAEAFLRVLGVEGDLRVRHLGGSARIEVDPSCFAVLDRHWARIEREFRRLGFGSVARAAEGYRRGAMLTLVSG